jgi:hypothetical protein
MIGWGQGMMSRQGWLLVMVTIVVMVGACGGAGTPTAGPPPTSAPPTAPSTTSAAPTVNAKGAEDVVQACAGKRVGNLFAHDPATTQRVLLARTYPDDPAYVPLYSFKDRPYLVNALQWQISSVVACLTAVPGSAKPPLHCPYKKQDGTPVTVTRIAYELDVAFYSVTGELIAKGGRVVAPVDCPLALFNQTVFYGVPDDNAVIVEVEKFLAAHP